MRKNSQTKSVESPILHFPQTSNGHVNQERKKRIWHLSKCHPSTKWLARVHHVVVFKTKVLHFKIENTPIKDTNGKRKFKRMLSFLFVDKRKLFAMTLHFEEFNLVFYGSERLACFEQTRKRGFWRQLRYIPYSMIKEKYVFKREFFYFKGFMDGFLQFWHGRERKTTKCAFEIFFCHVLYRFNLQRNDLTCFTRIAFWINLRGFE